MNIKKSISSNKVSQLYDELLVTEQKIRPNNFYPIYKILHFDEPTCSDIYQWIDNNIGLPVSGVILDAGCGIGWGSAYLASQTQAKVTGISISSSEINFAIAHTQADNLGFTLMSFDDVLASEYSMIIAIESVKHSLNISETIRILVESLKPMGQLIIVDDFYVNNMDDVLQEGDNSQFRSDWQLNDILSCEHLPSEGAGLSITKHDLTGLMSPQYSLLAKCKHILVAALLLIKPHDLGWQAFRGGYLLEKLYLKQKMRYKVIVLQKGKDV